MFENDYLGVFAQSSESGGCRHSTSNAANDYNLSVSSYVEAEDTREKVDITKLNAELKTTVARIDQLRTEIDAIVAEIEAGEVEA